MGRRVALVLATVTMAAAVAVGQNARMDALNNFFLVDDMSTILVNPADMNDYKDAVQATYDGTTIDPAIGIKGIGDVFSLGLTYNPPAQVVDPVPHLLLGMGLDPFGIGLELYYERDLGDTYEKNVTPAAPGGTQEVTTETSDAIAGAVLGFNLNPDIIDLALIAGFRMPFSSQHTETFVSGVSKTIDETKAVGTFGLSANAEVTFDMGIDWTTGLEFDAFLYGKSEVHDRDEDLVANTVTDTTYETGSDDLDMIAGVYTGLVKDLEDYGILVGGMVRGLWLMTRTTPLDAYTLANYDPGSEWTNSLFLSCQGMVEKEWSSLKRLDAIQGRCGVGYWMLQMFDHEQGDTTGYSHEYREKVFLLRNPNGVDFTLGLGITKGILQFDVDVDVDAVVNALKWVNGNSAADDLASATLTLDFKKLKSGRRTSSSAPAMAPEPAPSYDSGESDLGF